MSVCSNPRFLGDDFVLGLPFGMFWVLIQGEFILLFVYVFLNSVILGFRFSNPRNGLYYVHYTNKLWQLPCLPSTVMPRTIMAEGMEKQTPRYPKHMIIKNETRAHRDSVFSLHMI